MYDKIYNMEYTNMNKDKRIILRLDFDLHKFLTEISKKNRTTVSHEVRQLILEKFNENKTID
jgi:hypothetical protein